MLANKVNDISLSNLAKLLLIQTTKSFKEIHFVVLMIDRYNQFLHHASLEARETTTLTKRCNYAPEAIVCRNYKQYDAK